MGITSNTGTAGAKITKNGSKYSVMSGATLTVQGGGTTISDAFVSGFGKGSENQPGAIPGVSGGTDHPALVLLSAGGVALGATVDFGGVVMAVDKGSAVGGSAFNSGSFAAANGGIVDGATIGSRGGVLASMISGYDGGAGVVVNTHVQSGGYGLAGGGFTIKGKKFEGSGVISNGRFDVGSTEILQSAGTDIGSTIGGSQVVMSAGVSMKSIFSAGIQLVKDGGLTSGATASAGGRIVVSGGGVGSSLVIGSGGSLQVGAGGRVNGLQVQAAAAATAEQESVVSGVVVSGGGTFLLNSGATLVNAVVSGTSTDGGPGGLLILQSGAVLSGVTSMGWKSRLDIDDVQYSSGSKIAYSGNTLTVRDSNGNLIWSGAVTGLPNNGVAKDFHLERDAADGSTVVVFDKCFLKGTMIRTDQGERAVEELVVGDRVAALCDGKEVFREIIWIGRRSASVRPGQYDDEAGYPVRILRGALGDNVPHKDLLVTPEHALFINGAFVPTRMLTNGRSIFYDRTIANFDYYHVETDKHSILWSDGALSESYLDTGARDTFSQGGPVVRLLNAPVKEWAKDAAVPLRTDRDFVEPLHAGLNARADELELGPERAKLVRTEDADLHLVDDQGREIRSLRKINKAHIFTIPADVKSLKLVSRVARPVDTEGAFVDDRRHLGVLVGEIQVWEAGQTRQIDAHLTMPALAGWSNVEDKRHRWTTGNADLPLDEMVPNSISMLSIEILAGGPYASETSGQAFLPVAV